MKKNKFAWIFASSALLALSLTTNKVKADTTADNNTNNQTSTDSKQIIEKPNSDIILNKTNDNSTDIVSDNSKEITKVNNANEGNNVLNTDNTDTTSINSVNSDDTNDENDNIIESTWETAPIRFDKSTGVLQVYAGDISSPVGEDQYVDKQHLINADSVTEIDFVEKVNILDPNVSDSPFSKFHNVIKINASNLNTSNIIYMDQWFARLYKLTSLDLSGWDTSNVINMESMFDHCHALKTLNIKGWNTANVSTMEYMFYECYDLKNLNTEDLKTDNVTDLSFMFTSCKSLTSLDLSNWKTTNVTTLFNTFSDMESLEYLNISNWDTSNVNDMSGLFDQDKKLTSLDISRWNTTNVTDMPAMFNECTKLTSLDLSNWDTTNVTNMWRMFDSCTGLTSLYLNNWDTTNVTDMLKMFNECTNLSKIVLGEKIKFLSDTQLPNNHMSKKYTGRWIKAKENSESYIPDLDSSGNPISVYESSEDFMNKYNGTHPGIYVREPATAGTVTIIYVDEDGNKISDDIAKNGNVGDTYTSDAKSIRDYTLVKTPDNAKGTFTDIAQTVAYVYKKDNVPSKLGIVTAYYKDTDGNYIIHSISQNGALGSKYKTDQLEFDGYTFKEVKGETTGIYLYQPQSVTYIYSKNSEPIPDDDNTKPAPVLDDDNTKLIVKPGTNKNNNINSNNKAENIENNNIVNDENKLPQTSSNNNIFTILIGMIISLLTIVISVFKKNNL